MSESGFRLRNKKILLTYPQFDIAPIMFQEAFVELCEKSNLEIHYMCIALEDHHETEGKHIHCYVEFENVVITRHADFFDIAGKHPNIEIVKCTPYKTVAYVMKDCNFIEYHQERRPICPFEKMSKSEKNRFILEHDLKNLVDDGVINILTLPRMSKAIREYKQLTQIKSRKHIKISWFYGPTGTGKTYTAHDLMQDKYGDNYWVWNGNFQWFDGYEGQKGVIIDDFRRQEIKFNFMLQLLQAYRFRVPIKGGFVNWIPEWIIITCPVDSREAWQWVDKDGEIQDWDSYEQLERRITEHREFTEKYVPDDSATISEDN